MALHNSTDVSANDDLVQCIIITVDDHLQTSVGTDIGRAEPAFRQKDGLEVLPSPVFIILCLFSCLVGFFPMSSALDVVICPKSSFSFL